MKFNATHKSVLVALFVLVSLATMFVLSLATYDYSTYKTDFYQLQQSEKDTLVSELTKSKSSAEELLSLTQSRIEATNGNPERIQMILLSVGQLAAQLELPLVLSAKYEMFSTPDLQITRFGIKPLQRGIDDTLLGPKVVLEDALFTARKSILSQNNEIKGILILNFDKPKVDKNFETLSQNQVLPEYEKVEIEGTIFYAKPPLSFWEKTWENTSHFIGFWIFTLLTMLSIVGLYGYLRRSFETLYGEQISRLKKEISGFIESEFKHQSYHASGEELQRVQSLISLQQQNQIKHLRTFLSHFIEIHKEPNSPLSEEERHILNSCLVSLDSLSTGLCAPLHTQDVSILKLLEPTNDLFAVKINANEITFEIDCPEELTIQGGGTFLYLIFLNVIGRSLYRVYPRGTVRVQVLPKDIGTEIIVTDSGEAPSHNTEKMIQESFPLFIANNELDVLCMQAEIIVKRKRIPDHNITTITIPVPSAESVSDNVVPLFQ